MSEPPAAATVRQERVPDKGRATQRTHGTLPTRLAVLGRGSRADRGAGGVGRMAVVTVIRRTPPVHRAPLSPAVYFTGCSDTAAAYSLISSWVGRPPKVLHGGSPSKSAKPGS